MMTDVNVKIYNEIPPSASSGGSDVGSNPMIYSHIEKELLSNPKNIEEVHFALYLFNNRKLYAVLKRLAANCKVTVTSLPLTGYDSRKIKDAQHIYTDIIGSKPKNLNFSLLIFPHMYVWHKAEYAGGTASYSFHIKAGFITYKSGACKLILTSCNMAPGDPYHSETAIVIEDPSCSTPYGKAFKRFFEEIEHLALPWNQYYAEVSNLPKELQQAFDFVFIGKQGLKNWVEEFVDQVFFTGPFIKIKGEGSTHYARKKLVETIRRAENRILVCAQHVHDLAPFNGYTDLTLIAALIEKKVERPAIEVKVLKQVSSAGLADKRRAAFVECHLNYAGVEQRVNKLVHDKFIIADDIVIITTSNFTATQFGWGERAMEYTIKRSFNEVNRVVDKALRLFGHPRDLVSVRPVMSKKRGGRKTKIVKQDIFAEVNGFIIIEDCEVANKLASYFYRLWNHPSSRVIEVPR